MMKSFFKWLSGLFSNPANGDISHTKLWANVAACVMTVKFARMDVPPMDLWWAYGTMVGGYALIRRGIAAVQQVGQQAKPQDVGVVSTGEKDVERPE